MLGREVNKPYLYKKERDMKKLALALGVALALGSCNTSPEVQVSNRLRIDVNQMIRVVTFEGHEYLTYEVRQGGSLCHSESCPCKSSK